MRVSCSSDHRSLSTAVLTLRPAHTCLTVCLCPCCVSVSGTYVDKKCPFTSSVSIRGRLLKGYIHSAKMTRTVIVRRDYLHYVRKYNRYEKRHTNLAAHVSPAFRVKEGDSVTVGECRPLSKTVRFNVLKVDSTGAAKGVKLFAKF